MNGESSSCRPRKRSRRSRPAISRHSDLFAFYRERAQADADANGDGLNCFTWVAEDTPSAAGRPLAGVPLAVKDLFCTEGVPSQSGSRILEGYRPPYTATSVAKLKHAGATLLAKTNQDEFAMGSSTENSAYGPTLNPWDRTRVPGGSSGGSAAAVAAGLAPWALGTDTGGSIRQPAALCGIVGLKPTYGAVSRYGMIAFASSLDQAGPLTRDVTDAALLFGRMVGQDPCDATSLQFPEPIVRPTAERLDGIRLGVPAELRAPAGDFADAEVEPGVRDAFEHALKLAEELGASVHEISLPHAPHALSAYYVLAPSEARSNLARFDGVRYGMRAPRREGPARHVHAHAPRRLRHGGQAADHARHLRALLGLLRRLLRKRAARAHEDRRRLQDCVRQRRFDRHADVRERRLRARREDGQPMVDVPQRLLHRADVARRHPRDLDPVRARRAGRRRCGANERRRGAARGRAARSACRSPVPRSARTACSTPRMRSSRHSASPRGPRVSEDATAVSGGHAASGGPGSNGAGPALEPVIGLEIHVQLATKTKMFCGCELSFGEPPNTRTCAVCLGLPGSLPVANAKAVHFGLMIGLALGSELAPRSIFHRKNYFYPDLPKGYQISQFDEPLCLGGRLGDVRIHRVHLEEDAAKLIHVGRAGGFTVLMRASSTSTVAVRRLRRSSPSPTSARPSRRASG